MGRRGRPWGDKTDAVWRALSDRPMTRAQIGHELQLSYSDAHNAIKRLTRSGWIKVTDHLATGRRPAAVYSPSNPSIDVSQLDIAFRNLVSLGRRT